MFKFISAFVISLSIVFLSVSSAQAQSSSTQVEACLSQQTDATMNCQNYLNNNVIKCLQDTVSQGDLIWSCQDQNDDGNVQVDEVAKCAGSFANYVCTNVQGLTSGVGISRSCQDKCAESGTNYKAELKNIFEAKYNQRTGITPTATPTPATNSVVTYDTCTSQIETGRDCTFNMIRLDKCYEDVPPESGVWSCQKPVGGELSEYVCEEAFLNRVQSALLQKISITCMDDQYTSSTDVYDVGGNKYLRTEFQHKREARKNPSITPTPAVVDDRYSANVPEQEVLDEGLINQADALLKCGFANGDTDEKRRCCNSTIDRLESEIHTDRYDNSCTDGGFFGLNCWKVFDFKEDIRSKLQAQSDKTISGLNESEVTRIPQCFVGNATTENGDCTCKPAQRAEICKYLANDTIAYSKCNSCMGQSSGSNAHHFYSAIGCIDTSISGIIEQVFTMGIGIAGLIALLCIIYSSFQMQISQNNPEAIQKAQENITSCITGLIMIIFSVFILRVLGVDILRLPGFERSESALPIASPVPTFIPAPTFTPVPTATLVPGPPLASSTPGATPTPTIPPISPPVRPVNYNCTGSDPGELDVYLYDELNFGGPCLKMTVAAYADSSPNLQDVQNASTTGTGSNWFGSCSAHFNDCIASVKVGSKVTISLYKDPNYTGSVQTFSGNGNVSSVDSASSLKVVVK